MLPQAVALQSLKSQINRKGGIAKSRAMKLLGALSDMKLVSRLSSHHVWLSNVAEGYSGVRFSAQRISS
jgi:hypothetical protein